jgi:hypothetical protein
MFEFITVSNNPQRIPPLERSLHAAMAGFSNPSGGRVWRLTVIDGKTHNLFSGYNAGAADTASGGGGGDILCFIHHDILLLSNAIAFERPLALLNDPTTGVIGPVGATRLNAVGTWWGDVPPEQVVAYCRGAVGVPERAVPPQGGGQRPNPFGFHERVWPAPWAIYGRTLLVDGVLMLVHRRSFEKIGGFDDKTFSGFHFYDIDLSLSAHFAGLKNFVAPIHLFHDSTGTYDAVWDAQRQIFLKKWQSKLPVQVL